MPKKPKVQRICTRGRSPYYRLHVDGKRHYLGTDPERASGHPRTVSELVGRWLREQPERTRFVKPWSSFAGEVELDGVGRDALKQYTQHLLHAGKAPATVRKYVCTARLCLEWGHERGRIDEVPPMPKSLPAPALKPRDEDPERLARAFEQLTEPVRRICMFILFTGCRPGEACRLEWEHVDLKGGVCILPEQKMTRATGRARTIYLTPEATDLLKAVPEAEQDGYVFMSRRGNPHPPGSLRSSLSRRGIRSVYSLRHTFAQKALDDGASAEDVARLLGHRDLRTVPGVCTSPR